MATGCSLRASVFGDPVLIHPDRTFLSLRVVLPRCRHTSILLVGSGASTSPRTVQNALTEAEADIGPGAVALALAALDEHSAGWADWEAVTR